MLPTGKVPDDLPEQGWMLVLPEEIRPVTAFTRNVLNIQVSVLAYKTQHDADKSQSKGS